MKGLVFFTSIFFSISAFAQDYKEDAMKLLQKPHKERLSATVLDMAQSFIGKPYVAATLEKSPEHLVFNLQEFDCYTLVENALALGLAKHHSDAGMDTYKEYLQLLRYRGGIIDGYGSRMHYFTDWALQAIDNDILVDIGKEVGTRNEKTINFMTQNRKLYGALAQDDEAFNVIQHSENELNKREYYYIPKTYFSQVENVIQEGDIIAFTSTVKGLDVNHEGFAIKKNGKWHLLHASLEEKTVIISPETLEQYLNRIKKHSGIMILRIKE